MPDTSPPERFAEPYDEQLGAVLEARVTVVSFTFGLPDARAIDALHDNGTLVVITVTSEPEERAATSTGAVLLCAQGVEAGGHRASFLGATDDGLVGLVALVPRVVDASELPVVASGGIMDGRGVAASLALGAGAAQLGGAPRAPPVSADPIIRRQRPAPEYRSENAILDRRVGSGVAVVSPPVSRPGLCSLRPSHRSPAGNRHDATGALE
jgi:hypothetical protein